MKYLDSVMIRGTFGYSGKSKLVVLPKNVAINIKPYLELSSNHLEVLFDAWMSETSMYYDAPAHKAKLVADWFENVRVDYIKDLPGISAPSMTFRESSKDD